MRKIALVALTLLLAGCPNASWQDITKKSLAGVSEGAGHAVAVTYKTCRQVLDTCIKQRKNPCAALQACQKIRRVAVQTAQYIQMLVLNGYAAVELSKNPEAQAVLKEAQKMLMMVQGALEALK